LRQVALDLSRFADKLEAETDLDPGVLRYCYAQLAEIAVELEQPSSPAGDRA